MRGEKMILICFVLLAIMNVKAVNAQIARIWLTHKTNKPSHIVINWESSTPGNSEVSFGTSVNYEYRINKSENVTIHHIEVPLEQKNITYHYMVKTGGNKSKDYTFKGYPTDELRVAIVANWGGSKTDLSHLISDNPHLLLTCGDNVPNLYSVCGEGEKDCVEPYLKLIDSAPEVFHSIPFMPILGNHDKQIRDRGTQLPKEAVYDTTASAFRKFMELPDDEWKWSFKIPDFDISFIALDLNHTSDLGTTYQSCHDYRINSDQFEWYSGMMNDHLNRFVLTLSNENNNRMRNAEHGEWGSLFEKGTAVISGFGYYSERAVVNNFPYFNTSLKAGDKYPDSFSKILSAIDGYILLTFRKNSPMIVELKSLDGEIIDRSFWSGHKF